MKKLIIVTACLSSLVLFSFIPSKNNEMLAKPPKIKLIKPYPPYYLYSLDNTSGMKEEDQAAMKKIFAKMYQVNDFKEGEVIQFKNETDPKDTKSKWWVATNKTWGPNRFTEKAIGGRDRIITEDIKSLVAILNKYVGKGE